MIEKIQRQLQDAEQQNLIKELVLDEGSITFRIPGHFDREGKIKALYRYIENELQEYKLTIDISNHHKSVYGVPELQIAIDYELKSVRHIMVNNTNRWSMDAKGNFIASLKKSPPLSGKIIATERGWEDPDTGELLVSISPMDVK